MFVWFVRVRSDGLAVQVLRRVLVDVIRFLFGGVDVGMRVFVRMRVRVGVRVHGSVGMPVFVRVEMCMFMLVLSFAHGFFLFEN